MTNSTPESASAPSFGIDRYGFVLKRQWPIVVVMTLIGAVLAWSYLLLIPTTATATTDVSLNVIATNAFSSERTPASLLSAETESEIAHSSEVAARAARALNNAQSAEELRAGLETLSSSDGQIVHLSYTAPTPSEARAGADALADSYLAYRGIRAESQIKDMIALAEKNLAGLEKQLADARTAITAAENAHTDSVQARTSRDVVTKQIDRLVGDRNDLVQIDTSGGQVISPATANPVISRPNAQLTLAGGLLAGLVLGLILAFPVNALDRRYRNASEVDRAFGTGALANLTGRTPDPRHIDSEDEDALRIARERILAQLRLPAMLTVVDDATAEGGSGVPVKLAVAFTQSGIPVRVVFADVAYNLREQLGAGLGLTKTPGKGVAAPYRSELHPGLDVCFLPSEAEAPADSLDRLDLLIADGITLLVVSPAARSSSRVAALRLSDGLLLVLATRASRSDRVAAMLKDAEATSTPFLGAVTTPKPRRARTPKRVPSLVAQHVGETS